VVSQRARCRKIKTKVLPGETIPCRGPNRLSRIEDLAEKVLAEEVLAEEVLAEEVLAGGSLGRRKP
jgi:hypothetical protein